MILVKPCATALLGIPAALLAAPAFGQSDPADDGAGDAAPAAAGHDKRGSRARTGHLFRRRLHRGGPDRRCRAFAWRRGADLFGACRGDRRGSNRSSTFRARGVAATWGVDNGRTQFGVGAGYDQRKFIAAPGTILVAANGVVDENFWLIACLNGQRDRRSSFSNNFYSNWFQSGFASTGDATALGPTASYNQLLTNKHSATLAVGLDEVSREAEGDIWTASALAGVRYFF